MFGEIGNLATLAKYEVAGDAHSATTSRGRADDCTGELEHFGALYGACTDMRGLFRKLERLAGSAAPVIVLGESGSGKELVAMTLHQLSARSDKPFVAINCGAIAENLVESELFGHERGSFTGASRTHRGCFERADGGTLLLDEVTEMPLDMQVRLLRVLETGRFCRVGGDHEIHTDVRIIAATNRDLAEAVSSGKLREDLMYRLCVIPVSVPPLRRRERDALLLAELFLEQLNAEHGERKYLSDASRQRIDAHCWPGNVRELKNVIHRAFVLSDDEVSVDVTSPVERCAEAGIQGEANPQNSFDASDAFAVKIPVGMSLDDAERALITATLDSVSGSKAKAAQVLGISLKTLYNRLHAYGDAGLARRNRHAPVNVVLAA